MVPKARSDWAALLLVWMELGDNFRTWGPRTKPGDQQGQEMLAPVAGVKIPELEVAVLTA